MCKLSSRLGESEILEIEGFRQPRVAQIWLRWASDGQSGGLRSSPGSFFELRGTLLGSFLRSPRPQVRAFEFFSRLNSIFFYDGTRLDPTVRLFPGAKFA